MIVATQLDEGEALFGVDLSSRAVSLSPTAPPAVPTIVLAPAESFDEQGQPRPGALRPVAPMFSHNCDPSTLECPPHGGGGGIDWSTKPPGLYDVQTEITDLQEGWPLGAPEVEIFTLRRTDEFFNGTVTRCVGDSQTGDLFFDQNSNSWSGAIRVATPEQLAAEPPGEGLMFFMLENDGEACEINMDSGPLQDLLQAVNGFMAGLDGIKDGELPGVIAAFEALIDAVLGLFASSDDPIGLIVKDTCPNPDGITSSQFTIVRSSGTTPVENGCAELFLNE